MTEPKRERTLYEIASSFFAAVVIAFAVVGLLATGFGDDGPGSAGFVICAVFLILGLGRLYVGLTRGGEGEAAPQESERPAPAAQRSALPRSRRPPPRRRRP